MRALIKALDPLDQFKNSVAHSAAIMAFELAALPSPSAGNVSLHGNGTVIYWQFSMANALIIAAGDRHNLHGVYQPPT